MLHAMAFDLDVYLQSLSCDIAIFWIIFTCGTNTTHEGTICYVPFPGQRSRSHRSFAFLQSGGGILVDH